jgi:tetratricopeptide (TPR) repeat protein
MFTAIAALAGWLTLAAPPPEAPPNVAQPAVHTESTEAWVERLKGLRDHMHTAFGVGPDLTLLEPDQGVAIVQQAWPQLKHADVKTGLLKTFAFSKALDTKHPKLFQVLDLGMNDSDPDIRAYAASYISEYSQVDFTTDPQGYAAWFEKFGDKTPDEVLELQTNEPTGDKDAPISESAPSVESLNAEGWKLFHHGASERAVMRFAAAVALDPKSSDAWNGLGWSRFNSGDPQAATDAFKKCLSLDPNQAAALNGLGQIALSEGDLTQAEEYLKQAAPNASAAWYGLGRIYLLNGKYADAEHWIAKALVEQPNDLTLVAMLAAAKAKELPDDLKQKLTPGGTSDDVNARNAKGWQLFFSGNNAEAEAVFRKILATDPAHLAAMNGLGFALLNQEKPKEARPYFERILALEPNSPGPLNGLARCLRDEGDLDGAIKIWERALKISPGPNDCSYSLGLAYVQQGQMSKAIPLLEISHKANPDDPQINEALEKARAAN